MNTLKINIPEGFVVDTFDHKTGEIKFKPQPKKITDRIKTLDDVVKASGYNSLDQFDDTVIDLDADERAYVILKLLAKSLNEGWVPDWDNSNQAKYYPWFYMDGGSSGFRFSGFDYWSSNSTVGSRLCFKTADLATYAGKQFIDVYRQFMVINKQCWNN